MAALKIYIYILSLHHLFTDMPGIYSARLPGSCKFRRLPTSVMIIIFIRPVCEGILVTIIQYNTIQYNTVQYSTVQYSTVQCSAVQCSAVQCSAVQFSAVQCSAVQYSTTSFISNIEHNHNSNFYPTFGWFERGWTEE